ncbi:hypothetical protein BDW59DRAFT_176739 [Aspergillus cavernicola]|uniref:DUF7730 domain-containing protein n=1 Tax=Aspergillus cavernicola TaxID=176166 RepID=A0ABR4HE74_9EURO
MTGKRKRNNTTQDKNSSDGRLRRALTPPLPPQNKKSQIQSQQTLTQEQSSLFRLPREIRDIIYTEIFTPGVTIHIAYVGGRLRKFRSFLCSIPQEDQRGISQFSDEYCQRCKISHYACSPRVSSDSSDVRSRPTPAERRGVRVLAVLRSCRRVYTETINLLYEKNTFYIENPRTLLELPNYMPQVRLSSFRHLYLQSTWYGNFTSNDRLSRWKEVVDAMETLDGLKSLCVILKPLYGLIWEVENLKKPVEEARLPVSPHFFVARIIRKNGFLPVERCPWHGVAYYTKTGGDSNTALK